MADAHPEVVQRLQAFAETMRAELGDALTNRPASGARRPDVVAGAAGARSGTRGIVSRLTRTVPPECYGSDCCFLAGGGEFFAGS